jgi:hypothetical protein
MLSFLKCNDEIQTTAEVKTSSLQPYLKRRNTVANSFSIEESKNDFIDVSKNRTTSASVIYNILLLNCLMKLHAPQLINDNLILS